MKSLVFVASLVGSAIAQSSSSSSSLSPNSFSIINPPATTASSVVSSSIAPSGTIASGTSSVSSSASPSASASFPSCPRDNGLPFAFNGFTFTITCGAGTVTRRALPAVMPIAKRQIAGLNGFGLCIAGCASTVGCQSVLYNPATSACAVYNCVVAVPPGLAGARIISGPQGPIATQACPTTIPQNIPVVNNTINLNLNITIDIDVVINAFDYHGLPITSVCHGDKCGKSKGGKGECDVCKPIKKEECCICYKPDRHEEPPMKPKPGYKPAKCDYCDKDKDYNKDNKDYDKKPAPVKPVADNKDYDKKPSKEGKYTGPYSNDAVVQGASVLSLAGAIMALMI